MSADYLEPAEHACAWYAQRRILQRKHQYAVCGMDLSLPGTRHPQSAQHLSGQRDTDSNWRNYNNMKSRNKIIDKKRQL